MAVFEVQVVVVVVVFIGAQIQEVYDSQPRVRVTKPIVFSFTVALDLKKF